MGRPPKPSYETDHNVPGLVVDKKLEFGDGLFFVALRELTVIGTIMAGYDGHRGWIYSIAVAPDITRIRSLMKATFF